MRFLATLACASLFLSSAVSAQTPFVTNSVQQTLNVNDPLNRGYQQEMTNNCTFAGNCQIFFPKVQHDVLILHASCFVVVAGNSTPPTAATLSANNVGPIGSNQLQISVNGQNSFVSGDYNYAINADTYLIVAKGHEPVLSVVISGGTLPSLDCTVSGYHD